MRARVCAVALCLAAACAQKEPEAAPESGAALTKAPNGERFVVLDDATRARAGIATETLAAAEAPAELEVYGRVVADPERTFVVRAPVAGQLRADAWPSMGARVELGAQLGAVAPRLSASEHADLVARASESRGEADALAAELAAARRELARVEELVTDQSVSEREVEESGARVKGLEARQRSASERAQSIESALAGDMQASIPMRADAAGEVTLVSARPGESVEAGAALLEIVDLRQPLVEVLLPIGAPGSAHAARIARSAAPELSLPAEIAYRSTDVPEGSLGARLRLRVSSGAREDALAELRPGEPVIAWLALDAAPIRGASIPQNAIVRAGGKTWIWIERGEAGFARTEVRLVATAKGWIAPDPALAGAQAVSAGAQELLSFEILGSQSAPEEED